MTDRHAYPHTYTITHTDPLTYTHTISANNLQVLRGNAQFL